MNKELSKAADITADIAPVRVTREDIRKHFCPLATDQEVAMGLAIVKSLKLNPFLREVHFVKYSQKDKMAIIVGYEVYLKRAERTGKLNGWTAGINTAENYAWVKIHRKDWAEPFEWTVNLNEFNKKQSTWNQIPSFMGRKVAIAQGFRLCFPDELGGMPYTEEEHQVYDLDKTEPTMKPVVQMPQAISQQPPEEVPPVDEPEKPNEDIKIQAIESLAITAFKKDKKAFVNWLAVEFGCEEVAQLLPEQIPEVTKKLNEIIKNGKG